MFVVLCGPACAQDTLGAPFTAGLSNPASLTASTAARMQRARTLLAAMLAVRGRRTAANTLTPYDDLTAELFVAASAAHVLAAVHPDEQMRRAAADADRAASALSDEVQLRPDVYRALRTIDLTGVDEGTRTYVARELRDFRLAGVDQPAATRERIRALRDDLTSSMAEFQRNIREGTRQIIVTNRSQLDGLPADFVARHTPDASGAIVLSTELVDARPVLIYAASDDLRRRMYTELQNVGFPKNVAVLDHMLQVRAQLAQALGYPNWAAYDTATRMAGNVQTVSDFIDRVVQASAPGAASEYAALVARKQQDAPGAPFNAWDRQRYAEQVRRASYDFDSQSVRPYFAFDRVLPGVLGLASRIFGVTFREAHVPVWHPSVVAYDMLDGSTLLGRVYLDLHPRADKDVSGATTYTIRMGAERQEVPEAVLVASVPGGQPGDPGLMTHDEVRTLFHEFGHVLHRVIGGHQRWHGLSSLAVERDFAEVPSQMLEEWIWDPATLATFARHYQTGAPIPAEMVARMRRASEFGKALDIRQQIAFAKMSLAVHDRDPHGLDTTTLTSEINDAYLPYPLPEGTHRQVSFAPFANPGYASTYYTYMWSLVIAKDMFSRFDPQHLDAAGAARRYRDLVFAPGSSKPAAALVREFLGRPFDFAAWQAWVSASPAATPTQ